MDDEEIGLDGPFPRPTLLHRITDVFSEETLRETSLYCLPYGQGFWLDQVLVIGDWVVRYRIALDARLLGVLMPHFARIVEEDAS